MCPQAFAADTGGKPPQLDCKIGPLTKTYAKTQWLVYSCDDDRSLVVVTAPGNPAMPFYFIIFPKDGAYKIYGEGTGDKSITDVAHDELNKLTAPDIAGLVTETKKMPPQAKTP